MSAVSYPFVRRPRLLPLLATLAVVQLAHAGKSPAPEETGTPIDVTGHRDKLIVLSDGKQHFMALVPFGDMSSPTYYGDGKTFWAQRVFGFSSSGTESFNRTFWDPRNSRTSWIGFKDGKYTVSCEDRKSELTPVSDAERDTILAGARFFPARWKHRAYALARDNEGKYYYVDRAREPEQSRSFRLFVGTRGNVKLQKMINVVSDSEGDIFATKSGSLRLILNKKETTWVQGKKKTPLVSLPVEDNHVLIFTDLGAYTGQRLGTPCDDL
jgi:hypothetical protein